MYASEHSRKEPQLDDEQMKSGSNVNEERDDEDVEAHMKGKFATDDAADEIDDDPDFELHRTTRT